jgi:TolB protein
MGGGRFRLVCVLATAGLLVVGALPSLTGAQSTSRPRNGLISFERRSSGGRVHVVVARPDGTRQRVLATGFSPSFSPDGKELVYSDENAQLRLIGLTGASRLITRSDGLYFDPRVSPEGTRLVFDANCCHTENFLIGTVGLHGRAEHDDLGSCSNSCTNEHPDFSADGTRIVFASNRTGTSQIFVMNVDGSHVVALTHLKTSANWPFYSPGTGRIVFVGYPTKGRPQLFLMNGDGSRIRRLTYDRFRDYQPSFSPDGSKIVFVSGRTGSAQIFVVNADGTHARRVTHDSSDDLLPSWGSG